MCAVPGVWDCGKGERARWALKLRASVCLRMANRVVCSLSCDKTRNACRVRHNARSPLVVLGSLAGPDLTTSRAACNAGLTEKEQENLFKFTAADKIRVGKESSSR